MGAWDQNQVGSIQGKCPYPHNNIFKTISWNLFSLKKNCKCRTFHRISSLLLPGEVSSTNSEQT